MANDPTSKITDALANLMISFKELQTSLEEELGIDEFESDLEENPELEAAMIKEVKNALETTMDTEDYETEEVASLISTLTDSLEEIAPELFSDDDDDDEEEDSVYDMGLETEESDDDDEYYDDTFDDFDDKDE